MTSTGTIAEQCVERHSASVNNGGRPLNTPPTIDYSRSRRTKIPGLLVQSGQACKRATLRAALQPAQRPSSRCKLHRRWSGGFLSSWIQMGLVSSVSAGEDVPLRTPFERHCIISMVLESYLISLSIAISGTQLANKHSAQTYPSLSKMSSEAPHVPRRSTHMDNDRLPQAPRSSGSVAELD